MNKYILQFGVFIFLIILGIFFYDSYTKSNKIDQMNNELFLLIQKNKKEQDSLIQLLDKSNTVRDSLDNILVDKDSIILVKEREVINLELEITKIKGKYAQLSDDSLYNLIKSEYESR